VAAPAPEPIPEPTITAEAIADGPDPNAGAAAQGPATGAAGEGAGPGEGTSGTGPGQAARGSGRAAIARARWKSGTIGRADYPESANRAGAEGRVTAHFDVGEDGRVSGCIVVRSSGNAALDETTCRLIEQRFRYLPARDASGTPIADVAGWQQDWWLERR